MTGITELFGSDSTTVFTATLISMISIALGIQTGLLIWQAVSRLVNPSDPRAFRD